MLDGRVLGASQVEYKPFGKPPLKREGTRRPLRHAAPSGTSHVGQQRHGGIASLLQVTNKRSARCPGRAGSMLSAGQKMGSGNGRWPARSCSSAPRPRLRGSARGPRLEQKLLGRAYVRVVDRARKPQLQRRGLRAFGLGLHLVALKAERLEACCHRHSAHPAPICCPQAAHLPSCSASSSFFCRWLGVILGP